LLIVRHTDGAAEADLEVIVDDDHIVFEFGFEGFLLHCGDVVSRHGGWVSPKDGSGRWEG
jgi:hypothetical protein